MCGIVGYIGTKDATPILLNGLRKLEYRGYDSAGLIVINKAGKFNRVRAVGKIASLDKKLSGQKIVGSIGIAHTRWATHGSVTEENAHPHFDASRKIAIVHNGIIENYRELKKSFLGGINLKSETDSEILANLIAVLYKGDLKKAVEDALTHVRGTYGLVVLHEDHPDIIIAARMGSPLAIGINKGEYYIASDVTPFLAYTRDVVFLEDGEIAQLSKDSLAISTRSNKMITKKPETINWDVEEAEKQGFDYFMLKEIYDQPTVFMDAIRGRYNLEEGVAHLGGINMTEKEMRSIKHIVLVACGTAYYAGVAGKYIIEQLSGIPVSVEIASEFRYKNPIIDEQTLVFGVSQSGETADTIAALREARRKGAFVRGIVNVVGSTIARETDGGTYIHAGPELAVASTKAYTNMVAVLFLYGIQFGRLHNLTETDGKKLLNELHVLPQKIQKNFNDSKKILSIAEKYAHYKDFFFLGRGANYSVALEGSLKLKEISYIHSEAYPGGEMKHGPIALLSEEFPVLAVMTRGPLYEKMRSNVEEILARKAPLILIATEGDTEASALTNDVIYVPRTIDHLEPILNAIPLQLFAYHIAVRLGRDVDRPRNIAKSVTVE